MAAPVRFRAADRDATIVAIEGIDARLSCVPKCAAMARSGPNGFPNSIFAKAQESGTRFVFRSRAEPATSAHTQYARD
jgi:hypothetical protein